jgi:ATP-dependent Clp protease ATP-binding subunit ClpB
MTSNIGSHLIYENFADYNVTNSNEIISATEKQVTDLLKQTIRPEFLNRIDEIVMFTPLLKSEVREIVLLQLEILSKQLQQSGKTIEFSEKAINWLADQGYDPQYGARPVKRVIQRYVVNEISKQILQGNLFDEKNIFVDLSDGKILCNPC